MQVMTEKEIALVSGADGGDVLGGAATMALGAGSIILGIATMAAAPYLLGIIGFELGLVMILENC